MPITSLDLYRMGNQASPRMENVRPKDIDIVVRHGTQWVLAGTGGISTYEAPTMIGKRWWILAAGHDYGSTFVVRNNEPAHWLWEPAMDMPLDQFISDLLAVNSFFKKV